MNQFYKSVFSIADSLLTCRGCFVFVFTCFVFNLFFYGVCLFVFVLNAVQNAFTRVCSL